MTTHPTGNPTTPNPATSSPATGNSTGPGRPVLGVALALPVEACPRCESARTVSYGARVGCCHCGATWQAPR